MNMRLQHFYRQSNSFWRIGMGVLHLRHLKGVLFSSYGLKVAGWFFNFELATQKPLTRKG